MNKFDNLYKKIITENTKKINRDEVEKAFRYACFSLWDREKTSYGIYPTEKAYIEVGTFAISGHSVGKTFKIRKDEANKFFVWLEIDPYDSLYKTPQIIKAGRGVDIYATDPEDLIQKCADLFYETFPKYI